MVMKRKTQSKIDEEMRERFRDGIAAGIKQGAKSERRRILDTMGITELIDERITQALDAYHESSSKMPRSC